MLHYEANKHSRHKCILLKCDIQCLWILRDKYLWSFIKEPVLKCDELTQRAKHILRQERDFPETFQSSWQVHREGNKPHVFQGTVCPREQEEI